MRYPTDNIPAAAEGRAIDRTIGGGTRPEREKPAVLLALNELGREIDALTEFVARLQDRLQPVIVVTPATDPERGNKVSEPMSDVRAHVVGLATRVVDIRWSVASLLSNLEL